jgi:hypothetical protein
MGHLGIDVHERDSQLCIITASQKEGRRIAHVYLEHDGRAVGQG